MSAQDFRAGVESLDLDAMTAALADDVVLHSPVTFKPFQGKAAVRRLLGILLETFSDFRYTDELRGDGSHILVFRARVGDRDVEGIDLLRAGPDGLVQDFTVMVRPLSAAIALAEAVGPKLAAAGPAGAAGTSA
ncbi:MAG TPA: nuclear transport factor 2 family protein [Egibacteraceae bacterium]|nr:nuclear transport factor 2 family protein [Egibacteraceae bacterium]